MQLTSDFLERLQYLHPSRIIELLRAEDRPTGSLCWTITNEIKPVDLYCYLCARFGSPNGIQNWLRKDDSDNLIHWNWTFLYGPCLIDINGKNHGTEVWIIGPLELESDDCEDFIRRVKADFAPFGAEMAKCRKSLEHWTEFVNPYQRLRRSVSKLMEELRSLKLDEIRDIPNVLDEQDREAATQPWDDAANKCSRGFGICFGIRGDAPNDG